MIINGTEYGFVLTLGAAIELAKLCPKGDIGRYADLLKNEDFGKNRDNLFRLAKILNAGHVENERTFGREAAVLEPEVLNALPLYHFLRLQTELINAIARDITGEIETKETPESKKRKKAEEGEEA